MQTATRTIRKATPERWQCALQRAFDEGIELRQLAGCGMVVATSASDPTIAYEVSRFGCECRAGEYGDEVCKHRALFWHMQGALDLDDPEPPIPAAPAAPSRNPFGRTDAEMVFAKGQALRLAAERGHPVEWYLAA